MIERITRESDCFDELANLFDDYRVFYRKESNPIQAKEFLTDRIDNNESVIFITRTDADEISGFMQLYPIFSSTRMKGMWLLNDLYVAKKYRGKGFSKQLIKAAKEHCEETKYCGVMLETEKDNIVANNLYNNIGFEVDNDHNFYYWNT